MRPSPWIVVAAAVMGGVSWCCWPAAARPAPVDLGPVRGFVENRGQWDGGVRFAASVAEEWAHVHGGGITFGRGSAQCTLRAVPAGGGAPSGLAPTGGLCHFLAGADPAAHVRGARVFGAVLLPAVAPGVDLVLRPARGGGAFAYDLEIAAGADPAAAEFAIAGATLAIDAATGELVVGTAAGELCHGAPRAFAPGPAGDTELPCRFELRGGDRFGFRVAGPPGRASCIDPDLRWATCVGGSGADNGHALAVAANGDVFVAGTTQSTNLPVTPFAFDPGYNGAVAQPFVVGDAFVARLAAGTGVLLWCTYLGGSENDRMVMARAVGDEPVVTGWTSSVDFPTTAGAFDPTHNGTGDGYLYGGGDVFVTRLAGNGQSLVWSTFLGGAQLEYPTSLAVAPDGSVGVSGHVHSLDFPTTPGCFSATRRAFSDFFVTRLAGDGASLIGSTYCGGASGEEYPFAMTFAADGDLIVAGATDSNDLPVTAGCWDPTFNGGVDHFADGFVARFDGTLATLRWCTYLGTPASEYVRGLALHGDGSLVLTGAIDGPGLPVAAGVFGPAPFGARDGFAWRLSGNGTTTLWATYVGGSADDVFERAVALGGGRTAIGGWSASANVPLTRGALRATPYGGTDGWLCVLAGDGGAVDYATALGGSGYDVATDVARAPDASLALTGTLHSASFAVTPGGRPYSAGGDAFGVVLAALPVGVSRHGAPSGACARDARLFARSGPFVGEPSFALTAGDVPPASPALAAVSFAALATGQPLLGAVLWVDPAVLLATPAVAVDAYGCARLPLPIPADPGFAGLPLAVQFLWLDACPGVSLGASDALTILVQP